MKRSHGFALLWALAALVLAAPAGAQTLSVIGASTKVCQLTGQTDWYSGATTNAQTEARYGLFGVDLGFPVESEKGQLLFLFGDTVPSGHNPILIAPPDDAIGVTTRTAAPDPTDCLDMKMFGTKRGLDHPVVIPAIDQGSFNVPTGGIEVGGKIYGFFWTNHCLGPNGFLPNSVNPLALPSATPVPPQSGCPENSVATSLGRSVLAWAAPGNPLAFTQVAPQSPLAVIPQMPNGFVYVSAAVPPPPANPKLTKAPNIPVFGVARYRMSIPYLAMAPQASFADFKTWKYYAGMGASGPNWITYWQWQAGQANGQWAPPAGAELYANGPNPFSGSGDERCVGEHSVTWSAELHVWLLTYTCGGAQVEARTAPQPWGPWSKPTMLLSAVQTPSVFCTLFWKWYGGGGCPGLVSQQIPAFSFGYFYAPFVMSRYTEPAKAKSPKAKAATLYWLLSTWDPYQATVMKTTVEVGP